MSANTEYSSCFIFENGSDTIKYGLSHKDKPNFIATDLFSKLYSLRKKNLFKINK